MIKLSRSVHLLPVCWPLLIFITILTPYIIAESLKHVHSFLPTISRAAAFEPEGSIFRFMTTFVALFGMMFILARYLQLDTAIRDDLDRNIPRKVTKLNKAAVPFGVSCLLGVVVVANIQSNLKEVQCQLWYLSIQLLYRCVFLCSLFFFSGDNSFGLESTFVPFFCCTLFLITTSNLRFGVETDRSYIFVRFETENVLLRCSLIYIVYNISIN